MGADIASNAKKNNNNNNNNKKKITEYQMASERKQFQFNNWAREIVCPIFLILLLLDFCIWANLCLHFLPH